MSNEIARYDNDFNNIRLQGFDSVDLKLTMGIISRLKDQGTNIINISFDDMKRLSNYQGKDNKRFFKDLDTVTDKLMTLRIGKKDSRSFMKVNIFATLHADLDTQTLIARVNTDYEYLFNELTQYTAIELEEYTHLKSKYAQNCYRQLRQWKSKGRWIVTKEDFISLLDIPKSYTNTNINQRVLKPIREELSPLFEDFTISPIVDEKKRGHPIIRYEFIWTPFYFDLKESDRQKIVPEQELNPKPRESQEPKQNTKQRGVRKQEEKTTWEQTRKMCPECGKPLYQATKPDGQWFLGHKDFYKDGACKQTYNSYADVQGLKETPTRYDANTNDTKSSGFWSKFNPFKDF